MMRRLRDPQRRGEAAHPAKPQDVDLPVVVAQRRRGTARPTEAAAPAARFWAQLATQALLLMAATVVGMMPLGAAADPPRVVRPLDDLILTVNSGPHIVDLRGVYWGAPEKCEGISSDESIVAVSVEGYRMTLTPVGVGEATITATASNEDGSASHDFRVTVQHTAPAAVGELPDVVIRVGDTLPVELAGAFSGEALTYTASSSAEDNASVSVAGSTASIAALAAGTATIIITASNTGGSAEQSFAVTVKDVPPAPAGDLPDVTLRVGDNPITVDVAEAFTGSALVFVAASSAENLAQVSLADSTLSVTGLAAGTATVTVTATNSEGSAEQSFDVAVKDVPPAAAAELPDLTLSVGDDPAAIDVAAAFSGTALTFSAASSAEDLASVSLADSTLSVTGLAAGTATVTVTATNSEGSAEQSFDVAVKDVPPAAAAELPDLTLSVGDDPAAINVAAAFSGTALTFSAASSAEDLASVSLADSTLSVTGLAAGAATVTVTATNSEGSAEQSFDVAVKDVPPAAAAELPDLTLSVGDDPAAIDVAAAFSGTALTFSAASSAEDLASVSLADSTLSVTALAAGAATVTVTATNSEGSAEQSFVVTVKDVPPATTGSLPDVVLITGGDAALVEVAGSFTGTALVYTITNTGDAVGVSIAGSQVTVAPLVEGEATVTVTATNSEGTASLSFGATVSTDVAESDALENTVAAIARSTLASITSAVGARFRSERRATPAPAATTLSPISAHPGVSPHQGPQIGGALPAWSQNTVGGAYPSSSGPFGFQPATITGGFHQMPGMNFTIPLNAAGSSDGGWTPAADWTFWGHVDHQSFDGSGYDGSLTSLYLGADANFGENWLAGVAVSRSSGDADYEFTSARASGTGDLDTDMVSVLPYVHWTVGDVAELWAIAGAGWGDVQLERSATAQKGEADLSMWMLSAGGRRTLASAADWDFSLMGDAGVLEMQTDGGVGIIDDMNVSVGRIKLGFEGERMIVVDDGSTFSVFGQVSGRHDSGDGDTGSGVELSGGVRYDTAGRIRFEAKARLLSLHSAEDYEENGVSFSAIVQPRPDGSGMSLALSSYLGTGMGANNRPLEQGYGYPGRLQEFGTETDAWGMDARLGYTLGVQRLSGLLTPFAKFDMAGANSHGMRMGIRYDLANTGAAERLNLELSGGQAYDRFRREAHNLVEIRGELRF